MDFLMPLKHISPSVGGSGGQIVFLLPCVWTSSMSEQMCPTAWGSESDDDERKNKEAKRKSNN